MELERDGQTGRKLGKVECIFTNEQQSNSYLTSKSTASVFI